MEILDIYDENKVKTGRTFERGKLLRQGEFNLVVHIWILNSKNEFLIQRRAMSVVICPGCWSTTGGAATSGETSFEALLREVSEEIGIQLNHDKIEPIYSLMKKNKFCDVWLVRDDIDLSDVTMQVEEVCDVAYATKEKIEQMIDNGDFIPTPYLKILEEVASSDISMKKARSKDRLDLLELIDELGRGCEKKRVLQFNKFKKKLSNIIDEDCLYKISFKGELIGLIEVKAKNNPSVYIIDYFHLISEYRTCEVIKTIVKRYEGLFPHAKKFSLKIPMENTTVSGYFDELNYKCMFNSLGMNYYEKLNK